MNALVSFRKCTLTDEELLKEVDQLTDQMYENGKIPARHIPARPNKDYDLLVGELIYRFNQLLNKPQNPEVCDATNGDSSTNAGNKIISGMEKLSGSERLAKLAELLIENQKLKEASNKINPDPLGNGELEALAESYATFHWGDKDSERIERLLWEDEKENFLAWAKSTNALSSIQKIKLK